MAKNKQIVADAPLAEIYKKWFESNDTNYIFHVGKTGSGKTYSAVQRLKKAGSGVYLAPLRLLAWQVYDELNEANYPCRLLTGEEEIENKDALFTSSTIEMLDYNSFHETVIIDEAFMVADVDRGKSWLKAILTVKAKEVNIITSFESLNLLKKVLTIAKRKFEVIEYKMLQSFKFTDAAFLIKKDIPDRGVFVTFSRTDVLLNKMKFEQLGKKVSVLYGNLPPEVKKKQIQSFIQGENQIMVCTDVIGMGLNVPCDYIVFLQIEKYDGSGTRKLNSTEIKQISGRTGRYGLSSVNSFVSALTMKELNYLKQTYNQNADIDTAIFGFDYDIFTALPKDSSISDRISFFSNVNIIPSQAKSIIKKEALAKYYDIALLLVRYKFELKTQWIFLTAPMKQNNKEYFSELIGNFYHYQILKRPIFTATTGDAKYLEDLISQFELYLSLSRSLPYEVDEKSKVVASKEVVINELQRVLLDRRLSSQKKCKLCTSMLSIQYPYNYCNYCFQNKVKYSDYGY